MSTFCILSRCPVFSGDGSWVYTWESRVLPTFPVFRILPPLLGPSRIPLPQVNASARGVAKCWVGASGKHLFVAREPSCSKSNSKDRDRERLNWAGKSCQPSPLEQNSPSQIGEACKWCRVMLVLEECGLTTKENTACLAVLASWKLALTVWPHQL